MGFFGDLLGSVMSTVSFGAFDALKEGVSDLLGYGTNDTYDHQAATNLNNSLTLQHDAQQFQKEQTEANNAFTEKMWEKTNQYNSASAQVQRMKAAGINPLSGQMNAGGAQQVSSTSASSPTASVGGGAMASKLAGISAISQARLAAEQAKNLSVQTDMLSRFGPVEKQTALVNLAAQIAKTRGEDPVSQAQIKELLASAGVHVADTGLIYAKREGQLLNNQAQQVLNKYIDQRERSSIANIIAHTAEMYQNVRASKEYVRLSTIDTGIRKFLASYNAANIEADTKLKNANRFLSESGIRLNDAQSKAINAKLVPEIDRLCTEVSLGKLNYQDALAKYRDFYLSHPLSHENIDDDDIYLATYQYLSSQLLSIAPSAIAGGTALSIAKNR